MFSDAQRLVNGGSFETSRTDLYAQCHKRQSDTAVIAVIIDLH